MKTIIFNLNSVIVLLLIHDNKKEICIRYYKKLIDSTDTVQMKRDNLNKAQYASAQCKIEDFLYNENKIYNDYILILD